MSSTVEQIKERLSIVDVVSSYIKIEKAGKNFKGRCPFHNEKTPSFFVSPERESYYCFGCGAKGDIFTFVEQFEGLDFVGALKMLAARAGVELDNASYGKTEPNTRLFALLEDATIFFEEIFAKNEEAKKYLEDRGVAEATTTMFRVGFAPHEWRALHDYLAKKGYSRDEMLQAGLLKRKESEKGDATFYDAFRSRIIFPIADASGRIIAFSGRIFGTDDANAPKYINSPETPLFKKSETLYGFDKAKTSIRKYDFSVLVEGPIDLIMAHQAGFTNAIAVMGTAFTSRHIEKLRRLSLNMVVALDADDAGLASATKTARAALIAGMDIKIAALPAGSDPADTIAKDLPAWKTSVREAAHIVDFLLDRAQKTDGKDERAFKGRVRNEVLPHVSLIGNKIDQAHFISRIAHALHTDESVVLEELAKVAFTPETAGESSTGGAKEGVVTETITRAKRIMRQLAGIFAWHEKSEKKVVGLDELQEKTVTLLGAHPKTFFPSEEVQALAFEAEAAFGDSDIVQKHVEEMFRHLSEETLRERLGERMQALAIAEREGNTDEAARILAEYKELSRELTSFS